MASGGGGVLYTHDEEEDCEMLFDPPDPVDLLLAHSKQGLEGGPRPLDFVREKMRDLKSENASLRARVQDLEQTLSIVQTAQEWSVGKGMNQEQVDKMNEIRLLLEQAKKAKEDIATFSNSSRQNLYEKLRSCKAALKREREDRKEMDRRLRHAFDHSKAMKEKITLVEQQRENERLQWQEALRMLKEKHLKEMRRFAGGDGAASSVERSEQAMQFNEQVIGELTALHQQIQGVKQETVDSLVMGDSVFESLESHGKSQDGPALQMSTDSDDLVGIPP